MKTLSNNRGVSLVILIVAMTLIAILGASFVSLMGSKQKGFLYQIDSYRALNLANAGVEFAIRRVYEYVSATNDPPPGNYIARCDVSPYWTLNDFANGQFRFCFVADYTRADFNTIIVEGRYDGGDPTHMNVRSIRQLRVTNFMNYSSQESISRIPQYPPFPFNKYLVIPFVNSSGTTVTTDEIRITVSFSGNRHLQNIYFTDDIANLEKSSFFDYTQLNGFSSCGSPPPPGPPCASAMGIEMSNIQANLFPRNILSYATNNSRAHWCAIKFQGAALSGSYVIQFYSSGSLIGSMSFVI